MLGPEDCLGRGKRFAEGRWRHLGAARPDIGGGRGGGAVICGRGRWRKVSVQPAEHFVRQSKRLSIIIVLGVGDQLDPPAWLYVGELVMTMTGKVERKLGLLIVNPQSY